MAKSEMCRFFSYFILFYLNNLNEDNIISYTKGYSTMWSKEMQVKQNKVFTYIQ